MGTDGRIDDYNFGDRYIMYLKSNDISKDTRWYQWYYNEQTPYYVMLVIYFLMTTIHRFMFTCFYYIAYRLISNNI